MGQMVSKRASSTKLGEFVWDIGGGSELQAILQYVFSRELVSS